MLSFFILSLHNRLVNYFNKLELFIESLKSKHIKNIVQLHINMNILLQRVKYIYRVGE